MIKYIKHGINLVKHSFRDVGIKTKRSPHWETLEKHFLAQPANSTCAACLSTERLNVHHIQPFHLKPELELDPNNLITLCMSKNECHLHIGHLGSFSRFNPNVKDDAATILNKPNNRDQVIKQAMVKYYPNLASKG